MNTYPTRWSFLCHAIALLCWPLAIAAAAERISRTDGDVDLIDTRASLPLWHKCSPGNDLFLQ
jgi:hypothetical protein